MPFLTDSQLKQHLADLLREDVAELPDAWDSVISAANVTAQMAINSALGALGFSPAQVAAWDGLAAYNRSLGLFFAMNDGAVLIDFPQERIDALDRRKELSRKADPPFQYTANGVIQPPAAAFTGDPTGGRGVASGRIAAADSRVTMDTNF